MRFASLKFQFRVACCSLTTPEKFKGKMSCGVWLLAMYGFLDIVYFEFFIYLFIYFFFKCLIVFIIIFFFHICFLKKALCHACFIELLTMRTFGESYHRDYLFPY